MAKKQKIDDKLDYPNLENLSFLDEVAIITNIFKKSKYIEEIKFSVNMREQEIEALLYKDEFGNIRRAWRIDEMGEFQKENYEQKVNDRIRFFEKKEELARIEKLKKSKKDVSLIG